MSQHPVKDAPQQVVAQPGDLFGYLGYHPGQISDGQAIIGIGGYGPQGRTASLKDRAVIHGQDASPSFLKGVDCRALVRA